ncbi:MAG: response regulator transcription factor [Anaerolineae bacterium]
MSTPLRVLLADDHPVVRRGLRTELEQQGDFVIVGEVGLVADVVVMARQVQPQVVVMGIQFPDGSGLDACREINESELQTSVLILTAFDWDVYLAGAWAAGADGFFVKETDTCRLVTAIRQAAKGSKLYTPEQKERVKHWQACVQPRWDSLTTRERSVLRAMAETRTNADIAAELMISEKTVEAHATQIFRKLDVASRRDAVAWVRSTRLLDT